MKCLYNHISRLFLSTVPQKFPILAEKLTCRELIRVQGSESLPFLQGLITNDMYHLSKGLQSMFTMFLNKSGRVMCDAIIYGTKQPDTYVIECDKRIGNELRRHLRMFRVRKKIDIDPISNEYCPWVIFNSQATSLSLSFLDVSESSEFLLSQDPRVKGLGHRIILPKEHCISEMKHLFSEEFGESVELTTDTNDYKTHRYRLGVGEGIDDHPPEKCFPLESNCDYLHGVSFHKGCYIGQELTARVHHTGVIRKRLMPISLTKNIEKDIDTVELQNGSNIGVIRGSKNKIGLALIRCDKLKGAKLMVDGLPANVIAPEWWPQESSQHVANAEKN